jgi:two-component system, NarL family, response regulator YdfI
VIRLLIAAPSAVVRAGLEALAASSPELQVVGSLPDLSGAEDLHPDVVLAALLLEEIPPPTDGGMPPLVLLTHDSQPVWTVEALRLGVRAVLRRDVSPAEILAAVEAAAHGLAVIEPQDLDALLSSAAPAPAQAEGETAALTARETEVLRMIAEGAANKIIAWKLGISEHTVKFHVASILAKLGASSRTEAVTIGIRKGLVLV